MKIVIYSLNDVVTKFIYWKKIVIDTLNDTQKKIPQNHTQILYYKNCPSKMGEGHANISWNKYLFTNEQHSQPHTLSFFVKLMSD
jgi:hypothetical protein